MIAVEVSYAATPQAQQVVSLHLELGSTAEDAVSASGLLRMFPEISLGSVNQLGVFGKLARPEDVLHDGDRVEIYRPLLADPKEVRRRRAEEGKAMKKGGGPKAAA
ncbi:RnfH family protein [Uliginosibacterium sp. H1]|uniref:RnfH family protein n=1 Tax=Uliginosibacterium sp. H1 TaxID=3114757 RepID=UPI002E1872B1|nr:RnfH family protein [Uliginosibacterium sp. H1]